MVIVSPKQRNENMNPNLVWDLQASRQQRQSREVSRLLGTYYSPKKALFGC